MQSTNRKFFNFLLVLLNILQVYSDLTRHHNYDLLHNRHCGFSECSRIIGGEDAEIGQYPWMALLAYVNVKKGETVYYCGGAVISRRYIVTAAHCVHYHRIKSLMVLLGEYKLDEDPDCDGDMCAPPVQRMRVHEVLRHQDFRYANVTSPHDIALVRTAADINFNDFVQPICLPFHQSNIRPNTAEVAGWGSNTKYGKIRTTTVLQRLLMKLVPAKDCLLKIYEGQLCTEASRSKDTCNGDSGGPLMMILPDHLQYVPRYYLIGVLSYGYQICAYSKRPTSVYTDVSMYLEWILDSIY